MGHRTFTPGRHDAHTTAYVRNFHRRRAERRARNMALPERDCPACGMPYSIDKDAGYVCENGRVNMECLKAALALRYGK